MKDANGSETADFDRWLQLGLEYSALDRFGTRLVRASDCRLGAVKQKQPEDCSTCVEL